MQPRDRALTVLNVRIRPNEGSPAETKYWAKFTKNYLKKLPTIQKWAQFTKIVSIFRGASSGKNNEKWKIERMFRFKPDESQCGGSKQPFSVHVQEGSRVVECEVIQLDELLFNKNQYLVSYRLGMCISNDEFHSLFNFTLAKRSAWREDDATTTTGRSAH
jgi:hypothetical protein